MISTESVLAAEARIREYIRTTDMLRAPYLIEGNGGIYAKLENLQHTGSFKVRGAFNKVLRLKERVSAPQIVAASSGNHGAALAYALKELGGTGIVFVPENASTSKIDAIKRLGVEVRLFGADTADTEAEARAFAAGCGAEYVSPYNDWDVITGQATLGVEILEQLPNVGTVFLSVGGGGLIAGIGSYLKLVAPHVKIVGCSPGASRVMAASVEAGKILDIESCQTISDATAGGLEPNAITFELCTRVVDHWIDVTEAEIADAMRLFIRESRMVIEGSAGVAIAAARKANCNALPRPFAVVICGGNVSAATIKDIL